MRGALGNQRPYRDTKPRWVRYQPDNALSEWVEQRTAGARERIRRVMIVALARKLLIALWRFSETGLVPTGARLA